MDFHLKVMALSGAKPDLSEWPRHLTDGRLTAALCRAKSAMSADEWSFFCSAVSDMMDDSFTNGIHAAQMQPE